MSLENVLSQIRSGKMAVLFDGEKREGEADLIIHADFAEVAAVNKLRKDAGGMIVLAIGKEIATELKLPFLHEMFSKNGIENTYVKTNYNDSPPYTIPVNHRNAHTGVTDNDKSLAIKDFAYMIQKKKGIKYFRKNFRTPGHLPICVSKGIENRRGHTELAVELARRTGATECMVLCEMLDYGKALSKENAIEYAKKNNLTFIEGREI